MFSYTQPIELRFAELVAGVRSDVGLKLYGEDLDTLKRLGDQLAAALSKVRGAADVKAEQVAGLPVARIRVDRDAIARYGINAQQVLDVVETIGGREVGTVLEGQRRYALEVRFAPQARERPRPARDAQGRVPERADHPARAARVDPVEQGPAQVSRDNIQRRITVEANVRGRDIKGFVADAQDVIAREVKLPPGYCSSGAGQFKNLAGRDRAARARRAGRAVPHLRPALHDVQLGAARDPRST